ncbi:MULTISPECIES: dTMP kinase [Candidatus Ichthyocystis]|uniref:Thymidylate kinase n=1 Tax=Candidatus Ichthyocystis hellenicum TaxID=1561003 RepID=A0A0S4M351_9BURK|nr:MULTISPECIES: dTMP kinase [Ichthyocystis]CUT17648.1 Thymidylate kinase [Candidatus Ichthyocystis hellenicum]
MKKGYFITLEGLDGVGKSSQASWLSDYLRQNGRSVTATREPGGTSYGEQLRSFFLNLDICVEAELFLIFSIRIQHVYEKILPALTLGRDVVCERFMDATYAYQSGGRGMSYQRISAIEQNLYLPAVDLTFFLDAPIDILRKRLNIKLSDRFELQKDDFFSRVRDVYQRRISEDPSRFVVVDASQSVDSIRRIMSTVLVDRGVIPSTVTSG